MSRFNSRGLSPVVVGSEIVTILVLVLAAMNYVVWSSDAAGKKELPTQLLLR
jgi:hypothetical protein